jgi:hypothetical protein
LGLMLRRLHNNAFFLVSRTIKCNDKWNRVNGNYI